MTSSCSISLKERDEGLLSTQVLSYCVMTNPENNYAAPAWATFHTFYPSEFIKQILKSTNPYDIQSLVPLWDFELYLERQGTGERQKHMFNYWFYQAPMS